MKPWKTRHLPCPDCGSSDALAKYDNGSHCFACGVTKITDKVEMEKVDSPTFVVKGEFKSDKDSNISQATAEFYGMRTSDEGLHFIYTNGKGVPVAEKLRTKGKEFKIRGAWGETEPLWGMHNFTAKGKYVTLLEGERDALAAYQMMGSKWPTLSLKNGATSALKDCRKAYEYLNSFDNIVICFDADEPGQQAAAQVAELFGGKAKTMKHVKGYKDARDYLMYGDTKEFTDAWWNAEQYKPDGIVNGSSLFDTVMEPIKAPDALYPWEGLNRLTYGIRDAELVTITAGSGLGKSAVLREIAWHLLSKTEANIGGLFLEETVKKTGLGLMSLAANKPLHIPSMFSTVDENTLSTEDMKEAFDKTLGTGRVWLHDHFGSSDIDNIVSRVKFMAKALNCKYIFLDHITIVVSSMQNPDERKALDEIMTKLRMLVQETSITLFVVSHLKRPDGKGHEEGAATSLAQLRGSGSIAQLSDMVIGLERDGQAQDEIVRNTTKVRVLKNRFAGITGPACELLYNHETGRINELLEETL
jgi:twinkle protein